MSLRDIFNRAGDMLMPKELAPFAGPLSMMFAGPLGMPLALGLGQLGSAKMHSGKLDPYTALGTVMAGRAFNARNPDYISASDKLGKGIGTFFDKTEGNADLFAGFEKGAFPKNVGQDIAGVNQDIAGVNTVTNSDGVIQADPQAYGPGVAEEGLNTAVQDAEKSNFFDKTIKGFDSVSETIFPGFTDEDDKFSPLKALTTIGAATTLSQIMPLAEELKKQEMKDREEEGAMWRTWFESYTKSTGRSYGESPYPDSQIMSLWNEYGKPFGLAMGGRVGYNMGGDTGIIAAAPGMPEGMQLDGRDGLFISQGIEEKADDVPAMLSKNEFVLTADAMKGFDKMSGGNGNPRAAAQKMYQFMDQMEAIA